MEAGQLFCWNGLCFELPGGWEPVKIGKFDLAFEEGERLVLEMRWKRSEDRMDLNRIIQRRIDRYARDGIRLRPMQSRIGLPQSQSVEWAFLEWQGKTYQGIEVVRLCTVCAMVSVFRVFQVAVEKAQPIYPWSMIERILGTFSDHGNPDGIQFSIYDIDLIVPAEFRLDRFSFLPGAFELQFCADHGNIRYNRWAPAHLLLQGNPLEKFAETIFGFADWRYLDACPDEAVVLGRRQPKRWLVKICQRARDSWCYLKYLRRADRLMGIRYTGRKRFTNEQIDRLSRNLCVRMPISNHCFDTATYPLSE